jgi:HD-like signal output (HDOD) protein
VLGRIFGWFRRKQAQPPPPFVIEATGVALPPPTLTDMLSEMIAAVGGPTVELEPDQWRSLAQQIAARATSAPPPPSFPHVANQVLAAAAKPSLDLNELVGIVQRDGAIATALLRIANSAMFAPSSPITTLREAVRQLGVTNVVQVVLGTAGRSFYEIASPQELALFPNLWEPMFDEAMANAFTAGRLALDVRDARGERALLAGLLVDVGRPVALRILAGLIREGLPQPDEPVVLATLDELAPPLGKRVIAAMGLPDELREACLADEQPSSDAQIARLVGAIGAIQRRSPRIWTSAGDVRTAAEGLQLTPLVTRTLFAQRSQYRIQAHEMFSR